MMVNAQVLVAAEEFESRKFAVPAVGDDDGWLAVSACGLCGSDVASFTGGKDHGGPVVLGHEVIGRIAEIGPTAAHRWGVNVGDRVAVEEALPCMTCGLCREGRHRLCTSSGLRYGDSAIDHAPSLWGGYADAMYLHPLTQLHRVPDSVSDSTATLYIPLSNGLAWMRDRAELRPGQTAAIIGDGQHSIATALAAKHQGAAQVIVIGTPASTHRLALAASYGLTTIAIDPATSAADAIVESLGGHADVVVDMTPGALLPLTASIDAVAPGGTVLWGGLKRGDGIAPIPVDQVIRKELTVRGLWARSSWAIPAAFDWLATNSDLARLCEMSMPLHRVGEAFDLARHPDAAKRPLHIAIVADEATNPLTTGTR